MSACAVYAVEIEWAAMLCAYFILAVNMDGRCLFNKFRGVALASCETQNRFNMCDGGWFVPAHTLKLPFILKLWTHNEMRTTTDSLYVDENCAWATKVASERACSSTVCLNIIIAMTVMYHTTLRALSQINNQRQRSELLCLFDYLNEMYANQCVVYILFG